MNKREDKTAEVRIDFGGDECVVVRREAFGEVGIATTVYMNGVRRRHAALISEELRRQLVDLLDG